MWLWSSSASALYTNWSETKGWKGSCRNTDTSCIQNIFSIFFTRFTYDSVLISGVNVVSTYTRCSGLRDKRKPDSSSKLPLKKRTSPLIYAPELCKTSWLRTVTGCHSNHNYHTGKRMFLLGSLEIEDILVDEISSTQPESKGSIYNYQLSLIPGSVKIRRMSKT